MVRLIALFLLIGNMFPLNAQDVSGHIPLTVTVMPGIKPKSLHLILSNTSESPIHLKLGLQNNGRKDFEAFSFVIVDAHGRSMRFGTTLGFIEGVVSDFSTEINPGKSWSGDIDLQALYSLEHPEDPMSADQLQPGSYTIQAIYQGRPSVRPVEGRPYWLGIIQSSYMTYVLPS